MRDSEVEVCLMSALAQASLHRADGTAGIEGVRSEIW